ncbi:MAG TPA: FAD binding domain-containing protein, partial [Acidobacteriaceae bacterium]
RATLGGNLVNASPAADSPPALLVYDAEVTLVSAGGSRRLPYRDFHLDYKKTSLRPDELLFSIHLPRTYDGYVSFLRKVGTRKAQAISKVAIAALARTRAGRIEDIRIAAASLREIPLRLVATEQALLHQPVSGEQAAAAAARARASLLAETLPIDDIRSTARYRSAVAANLVAEFLELLASGGAVR